MSRRPPKGLRDPGKALWGEVMADVGDAWELDSLELHFLERACRCADELHDLERAVDADGVVVSGSRGQTTVHPALSEARQLRLVQLRLLGSVQLPDEERLPRTQAGLRGQRAARSRWDRRDHLQRLKAERGS